MKIHLSLFILVLLAISGCATYSYTNGYYHSTPAVEYHYPPSYYSPYGYGMNGLFDYPIPPIYPRSFYSNHRYPRYWPKPHHDSSRARPLEQSMKMDQQNHIEAHVR
ncbi:MAG TPA: hypothetical protein ACQGQX_07280 [Xylella taiwanensis]